ncbi:MAG: DUF2442 domain-containing protein [Bacteroidia bacterium]|jgi:hypothetical protein
MLLNVIKADYISEYKVSLVFNDGTEKCVDLEQTILNDHRKIFEPLRDINYFKNFKINFNTITWENEADFAPEYLYDLK